MTFKSVKTYSTCGIKGKSHRAQARTQTPNLNNQEIKTKI